MRDEEGLRELYAASYRRLVGQLSALTGSVSEAEDLVQEAFARAAPRWARLSTYENPEAWLRTVAVNLARSRWRSARRALAARGRLAAEEVQPARGSEEHLDLVRALRALPAAQRETLVLFHVADLPVEEVAHTLGVPVGTVKARLARGRAALAAQLRPAPPPGHPVREPKLDDAYGPTRARDGGANGRRP